MRFAVRVPISNRLASPSAIVETAQAAESLGFFAITVHDRLIFDGRWIACGARDAVGGGDDRNVFESLISLSYLAAKTDSIRLMVSVMILPLREVISLAKQVAVLDVLSGGRLILGIGVGSKVGGSASTTNPNRRIGEARSVSASKEFEALGVTGARGRIADEYLEAMHEIWTQPLATYSGRYVDFEGIQVFPKPAQTGGPPILVGGSSDAALQRAAKYGDGWLPNLIRPQQYAAGVTRMDKLAAQYGRRPRYHGLNFFTCVKTSEGAAMDVFAPTMGTLFSEADLVDLNLVGTPATVVERLKAYEQAGADLVELKPICRSVSELLEMLDLIANDVMPAFR